MMARILIVGAGASAVAAELSTYLEGRDDVTAEIKAAEELGEGAHPAAAGEPSTSTRGHMVGDRVLYTPKDGPDLQGEVIDLLNGHAVVKFDDRLTACVMIGGTMDDLTVIGRRGEAPTTTPEQPAEVPSRDARYDVLEGAQSMLKDVENGEVVAIALVGITSQGSVRLIASESTGQTLNMLAQGIQVADGTLEPDDD